MPRTIYITVTTRLTVEVKDGVAISDVVDNIDYSFISMTSDADVIDEDILDFTVTT